MFKVLVLVLNILVWVLKGQSLINLGRNLERFSYCLSLERLSF